MGWITHELMGEGHVKVNLVDKRLEEYVEMFHSFSGMGTSLGTTNSTSSSDGVVFEPSSSTSSSSPPQVVVDTSRPSTSIQVKLLNGKRHVVKINLDATVATLASMLPPADEEPFRLVTGFPPRPLLNPEATIEESGLKGAQVIQKKA